MSDVPPLEMSPAQWDIVTDILRTYVPGVEVWAFGSRAKHTAKPYSDLDLAIMTQAPMPIALSAVLSEAFSESALPYRVDLVDWAVTESSFRDIILRDKVIIQRAHSASG